METKQIERPDFVTDVHLEYLDDLRESGVTNMFGAPDYLMKKFKIKDEHIARDISLYWMRTFSQRHK